MPYFAGLPLSRRPCMSYYVPTASVEFTVVITLFSAASVLTKTPLCAMALITAIITAEAIIKNFFICIQTMFFLGFTCITFLLLVVAKIQIFADSAKSSVHFCVETRYFIVGRYSFFSTYFPNRYKKGELYSYYSRLMYELFLKG